MHEPDSTDKRSSGILVRLWRTVRPKRDYDDGPNEHDAARLIEKYAREYFPEQPHKESRKP